jgi:hypothetical protein
MMFNANEFERFTYLVGLAVEWAALVLLTTEVMVVLVASITWAFTYLFRRS